MFGMRGAGKPGPDARLAKGVVGHAEAHEGDGLRDNFQLQGSHAFAHRAQGRGIPRRIHRVRGIVDKAGPPLEPLLSQPQVHRSP